jgi:hypothetical protein
MEWNDIPSQSLLGELLREEARPSEAKGPASKS